MKESASDIIKNLVIEYFYLSEDDDAYYDLCSKTAKIVEELGVETIFLGCIEYLSSPQITIRDVFEFSHTFFALGLQDYSYNNPYKLIALLYDKAWDVANMDNILWNVVNTNNVLWNVVDTDDILWSVSVSLAQKSGGYTGYTDAYDPLKDKAVLEELRKIRKSQKNHEII